MTKRVYSSPVTTNTAIVTTTETVAATVTGVSTSGPGRTVYISAHVKLTTGTNTTHVTVRLRRGTAITDTLIGEALAENVEAVAGSVEDHNVVWEDTPGEVAGQSYVVTVQQTAASANGAIESAYAKAETD